MQRIKIVIPAICMMILLVILTGCGPQAGEDGNKGTQQEVQEGFPLTIMDSLDRKVTIAALPSRLVSLSPAVTEILFAIRAEDKLVGVTDYCDYPAEALQKPKVGSFSNPNIELVVDSKPDVIFTAAGVQKDVVKQFTDLGIQVVVLDATNMTQVLDNIQLIGRITGLAEQADKVVKQLENRREAVKNKVAQEETKPKVFFEVWDNPLMTAGPDTFIHDMIVTAGGINVAGDTKKQFVELNQEFVLTQDPDIYIINSHAHTPEDIEKRPGFSGLKAVQEGHVYGIEDDLVTLPGPRLFDGLEQMAAIIHPELF